MIGRSVATDAKFSHSDCLIIARPRRWPQSDVRPGENLVDQVPLPAKPFPWITFFRDSYAALN